MFRFLIKPSRKTTKRKKKNALSMHWQAEKRGVSAVARNALTLKLCVSNAKQIINFKIFRHGCGFIKSIKDQKKVFTKITYVVKQMQTRTKTN